MPLRECRASVRTGDLNVDWDTRETAIKSTELRFYLPTFVQRFVSYENQRTLFRLAAFPVSYLGENCGSNSRSTSDFAGTGPQSELHWANEGLATVLRCWGKPSWSIQMASAGSLRLASKSRDQS